MLQVILLLLAVAVGLAVVMRMDTALVSRQDLTPQESGADDEAPASAPKPTRDAAAGAPAPTEGSAAAAEPGTDPVNPVDAVNPINPINPVNPLDGRTDRAA